MSRPHNLTTQSPYDWIKWHGGRCPVDPEATVRVWFNKVGEARRNYLAKQLDWGKRLDEGGRLPGSIIGYRNVPEAGE